MAHNEIKSDQRMLARLQQHFAKHIDAEVIESVAYECGNDEHVAFKRLVEMCSTSSLPPQDTAATSYERAVADARNGHKVLVLMRGLPGSGKSTLAHRFVEDVVGGCDTRNYIFSTDEFFVQNGSYHFNPTMLDEAHAWNQRRARCAMNNGHTPIVIDNTNSQTWEMRVYCMWAVDAGYKLHVLEMNTSWALNVKELARRNTHNVSKQKLQLMLERYRHNVTVDQLFREFGLRYDDPPPETPPANALEGIFDDMPKEYLVDVLAKCDGDVEWAIEMLLEENKVLPWKSSNKPRKRSKSRTKNEVETVRRQLEANIHISPAAEASTSRATESDKFAVDDLDFDDTADGVIELQFGATMIQQLNSAFGDVGVQLPTGTQPQVEIPVNLAQQLHALYLESVFKQLESQQMLVENMIEEDEAFARSLQMADEAAPPPNLKQIMRDELVAQRQSRLAAAEWQRMAPNDIAHTLIMRKLTTNFPDVEANVLAELLAAHSHVYDDAVVSLRASGARYVDDQRRRTLSASTLAEMESAHAVTVEDEHSSDVPSHELRQNAVDCQEKRKELLERAHKYQQRGMPEVAAFFSGLASQQTQMCEHYNNLAAVQIINENFQRATGTDTLDLHYLRAQEALNALDIYLDEVIYQLKQPDGKAQCVVQVITGRGKHSRNGCAILRPAVQTRLRKRGLQYQMLNAGVLRVKVLRDSITTDLIQ